jgi:hypothetical protein
MPLNFYYNNFYFRGKWDMEVAMFLDSKNIEWIYEPKRFVIIKDKYTYKPDFYLPNHDLYLEIKSYFRNEISKMKFELFSKNYKIILIQKEQMINKQKIIEMIYENKIYKSNW